MADHITFSRRSPFAGLALPGRSGLADGPAGLTVHETRSLAIVQVVARPGRLGALAEAVESATGLALPDGSRCVSTGGLTAVWTGPDRWLVLEGGAGPGPYPATGIVQRLTDACRAAGSVTDQTDARGVLRLTGPRVRDVLAKGLTLDLHPRAFRTGMAASTLCAMIDVTLWQVDDAPAYDIAVARGYAGSFWHWLAESAAEFGLAVE